METLKDTHTPNTEQTRSSFSQAPPSSPPTLYSAVTEDTLHTVIHVRQSQAINTSLMSDDVSSIPTSPTEVDFSERDCDYKMSSQNGEEEFEANQEETEEIAGIRVEDIGKKRKIQKHARTRITTSWTWRDGDLLHGRKILVKGNYYWQCAHCSNRRKAKRYLVTSGSRVRSDHLQRVHQITEALGRKEQRLQRSEHTIRQAMERAAEVRVQQLKNKEKEEIESKLDGSVLADLLVRLIASKNLALSLITSPSFQSLIQYISKPALDLLPSSANTIKAWVMRTYTVQKEIISLRLQNSLSSIHFTVDMWKSPNNLALLGIIAHYMDEDSCLRHSVLALKGVVGAHTGENMAAVMIDVFESYRILPKLGYGMMDNASNNNTMYREISTYLEDLEIPWNDSEKRLRCNGHIINLSVKAFLFGDTDIDGLSGADNMSENQLEDWRRFGPLGKAHNLIVHVRHSPQRQEEFKRRSGGLIPYRDNDTRWNSWHDLIESILRPTVHEALDSHAYHHSLDRDRLSREDWSLLQQIFDFLAPFKRATLATEARNSTLTHVLPSIDFLLSHYQVSLEKHIDNLILHSMILAGMRKLEKYFNIASTSPAYLAAVVLNPAWKWQYFQNRWTEEQVLQARQHVQQYWECRYKVSISGYQVLGNPLPSTTASVRTDFDLWCQLDYNAAATGIDEYTQYCATAPEPDATDPRGYWMEARARTVFPNLSKMALDILSIPAMSAEPERLFSGAKQTITARRNRLADETIEALECLKSWGGAQE